MGTAEDITELPQEYKDLEKVWLNQNANTHIDAVEEMKTWL